MRHNHVRNADRAGVALALLAGDRAPGVQAAGAALPPATLLTAWARAVA